MDTHSLLIPTTLTKNIANAIRECEQFVEIGTSGLIRKAAIWKMKCSTPCGDDDGISVAQAVPSAPSQSAQLLAETQEPVWALVCGHSWMFG